MTELQASLIAIGSAIVIGVIFYNKWQEYKAGKSIERAFPSAPDDVLMNSAGSSANLESNQHSRLEPVFGPRYDDDQPPINTGVAGLSETDGLRSESDQENADRQIDELAVLVHAAPKESPIDELIDCAIPLGLGGPMRGEKILPVLQSLRHVGSKPVHFIGQRDGGGWESIAHGGIYHDLQAGVQLANRNTALNELEYSELVMRLRQIADELGAEPDVPDMSRVMHAAHELHQFVSQYDAQLSVNILSNGAPWAISALTVALQRQGFDLRPDGRLVMPDGDSGILFSLSTNVTPAVATTDRLTLLLDVPRVPSQRDGFGAMIACARSLSTRLDGMVVDDANQALSDAALGEIAAQVNSFYADMETAGIPAGSSRAVRLFS